MAPGPTDEKASRTTRCVNALVSLLLKEDVRQTSRFDRAVEILRPRLVAYLARKRLQKRSRGIISILGVKQRHGKDLVDPHLGEVLTDIPETDEQRHENIMIGRMQRFETAWAFWRFAVQMYIFCAVLFRICFEVARDPVSWAFEFVLIDLSSWLTIAYRFVAYKDDKGIPRYDSAAQRRRYLRGWFWLDLLGAIPFDFIGMAIPAEWAKCTVRFHRCGFLAPYWQLNRLLNCRGMFDAFNDVLEVVLLKFSIHPYVARVALSYVNFVSAVHFFACGAFLLFVIYYKDFEAFTAGPNALDQVGFVFQYAASMDFVSKNMVGQDAGVSFPDNFVQLVYNVVVSISGCALFALMLATIANYVSRPSAEATFQQDMDAIIDIMAYKKFPPELQRDTLKLMRHRHANRTHLLTHHEVLDGMPDELLDRILLQEGMDILSKVPLFQPHLGNKRFVVSLARMLKPEIQPPDMIIFEKGDPGDAMHFVSQGTLAVVNSENHDQVFFVIHAGGFVGEIALLMDGPRTATVKVVGNEFANLMTLHKEDFQKLAGQFPQLFRSMQFTARDRFLELNKDLFDRARLLADSDSDSRRLQVALKDAIEQGVAQKRAEVSAPRRASLREGFSHAAAAAAATGNPTRIAGRPVQRRPAAAVDDDTSFDESIDASVAINRFARDTV